MSKTKTSDKKPAAASDKTNEGFTIAGKKFNFSTEDKVCGILLILLIFLVHTIRSKFLSIPFERDEGIYSYFGILTLEGKIPYKDFYESKFPGMFYLYAFMVRFFGDTVEGMHTGFMWMNIFTLLFVYLASRSLFSPIAGIISAITFAFVSLTPNLSGFTVQSEHGVAFFIALGVFFYALAKKHNKQYYYFSMGLSMALAFMVKTSGVFLVLWGGLILITDFLFSKPRAFKTFLINLLSYSAGGILILIIFFSIIYAQGSFNDMIWWTYTHSKDYVNTVPYEEGVKYFKYTRDAVVQNHKFFWIHSILAVALCLFKPIDFKTKAFGITLLGFSFLTIVPGFYFYGHYWIQSVPGFAIVAGMTYYCVDSIIKTFFKLKIKNIKYIYLGIFVTATLTHMSKQKSYYFHPNYELILRQVYGNNPFPEAREIGNFINSHTKPEDNITLIGSEPQIYFYTHKKSPSRHAYFTAVVNAIPQHYSWQREFVKDVEKQKPKYIVFFNHSISLLVQPNVDQYVFEWANKYLTANYKVVGVIDMPDGQQTTYVWNENVNTYKPQGKNVIYIFEKTPAEAISFANDKTLSDSTIVKQQRPLPTNH
jgi:hypothetical protein